MSEQRRPWLIEQPSGFGCSVCRDASVPSEWGRCSVENAEALRKQNLDRHEKSNVHANAASKQNIIQGKIAPPTALFESVWQSMCSGVFSCVKLAS
eukprot:4939933-Pyramimonas_sp.AAC.1